MTDLVLGIDLGGTKIALATATLDGTIVQQIVVSTDGDNGAEQAADRLCTQGQLIVARTQRAGYGALRGVGLASIGITYEDHVALAPNVPGWEDLALPLRLRAAFPECPISITNDVKAATRAEALWGALQGVDTGLYLNLGTGIAVGIIVGGRVLNGAHAAAGEIGHCLRHRAETRGVHDGVAPLEESIGGGPLARRASTALGTVLTAQQLFERARAEPAARQIVDDALADLSFALTNLTIALDPECIAVGGGLAASSAVIMPAVRQYLERYVPFPPRVVPALLGPDASLRGALSAVMDMVSGTL